MTKPAWNHNESHSSFQRTHGRSCNSGFSHCTFLQMNQHRKTVKDSKSTFVFNNNLRLTYSRIIGLSVAVIVFCHFSVYLETRRYEQQVAAQQVTQEARKQFEKDKKVFKLASIIFGVLVLSCTPVMFSRIVFFKLYKLSLNTFHIIFLFATTLVFFNSLLNPVIYCIRIRQFRVAFIELAFRNVNLARAEEMEMQWFGEPKAPNRREAWQEQGRQEQQNAERPDVT